jgi:hypothetical protein
MIMIVIAKTDEKNSPVGCQVNAFNFKLDAIALSKYVSRNNFIKKFHNLDFYTSSFN